MVGKAMMGKITNVTIIVFLKLMEMGVKVLTEVKDIPSLEKLLVIFLFIIPIPFTMEGYFILKKSIKMLKNNTKLSHTCDGEFSS